MWNGGILHCQVPRVDCSHCNGKVGGEWWVSTSQRSNEAATSPVCKSFNERMVSWRDWTSYHSLRRHRSFPPSASHDINTHRHLPHSYHKVGNNDNVVTTTTSSIDSHHGCCHTDTPTTIITLTTKKSLTLTFFIVAGMIPIIPILRKCQFDQWM